MRNTDRRRFRPSITLAASIALHLAAAAALVVEPQRWPLLAFVLFLNHCVLFGAGLWPRSRLLGPNVRSLADLRTTSGNRSSKEPLVPPELALTFDDGPDPDLTPRVLDLLDRFDARATFFLIGKNAQKHPELVAEIAARGHAVANHTWSHSSLFSVRGPIAIERELASTQKVIFDALGAEPRYFRAPAGFRSPWLEPMLVRAGLHLVSWSRRGYDARESDSGQVLKRLEPGIAADGVLVLHDGRPPEDVGRQPGLPILDVLPTLLEDCVSRDFSLIALPNPYKPTKSLTPSA